MYNLLICQIIMDNNHLNKSILNKSISSKTIDKWTMYFKPKTKIVKITDVLISLMPLMLIFKLNINYVSPKERQSNSPFITTLQVEWCGPFSIFYYLIYLHPVWFSNQNYIICKLCSESLVSLSLYISLFIFLSLQLTNLCIWI